MRRNNSHSCHEYDSFYYISEHIEPMKPITDEISTFFQGQNVLEVSCGLGYWTRVLAKSAHRILAVDHNHDLIEIAQKQNYGKCKVEFRRDNIYVLKKVSDRFTSLFCGFFLSQVPLFHIRTFLEELHSKLDKGSPVVFIDHAYTEMSSPVSRMDNSGNTYQMRTLSNGIQYEVLKNYFTEQTIRSILPDDAKKITLSAHGYCWMLRYEI